jgi:hypothetical protein
MTNTLVLCGGTGAHVGLALLRLHTLGYALGFFDKGGKPFEFPRIFLVDQDAGDGRERQQTAWQVARSLVSLHPGANDWMAASDSPAGPELQEVTPLPVGPKQEWYKQPYNTLANRFDRSPLLHALVSGRQSQIDYSQGMMGSPAVGSLLFRLKHFDERGQDRNHDETFSQMLARQGRIVVAGSGIGGTGASVGPTLALRLADRPGNEVMAVMVLEWFRFREDATEADEGRRVKAQLRNRIMRQNANSALEFYGQSLARKVAAVPVGMPERSMVLRDYTGDVGQPSQESYIHAVAAQCAVRHLLADKSYGPGFYIMGAVEPGRLDGATAIPGGTLQDLANQAATVSELLTVWEQTLSAGQRGRVSPALYDAVGAAANPAQVAEALRTVREHYSKQVHWMANVLGITATPWLDLTREAKSRRRLMDERHSLGVKEGALPAAVAAALFSWTSAWVREISSASNRLRLRPGEVHGGHWPDIRYEGVGAAARANGDLTRLPDANIDAALKGFVDRRYLSSNGWPHPLAAATYFENALAHGDLVARRQLELLLCGIASGDLEVRPLAPQEAVAPGVSLETLTTEYRRDEQEGLAEVGVYLKGSSENLIGFNSPHTLLCPAPRVDDEDDALWQGLWAKLSGAKDGARWTEAVAPATWGDHDRAVREVRSWIEIQLRSPAAAAPGSVAPPWTLAFDGHPGGVSFHQGAFVTVYWGEGSSRRRMRVSLPAFDDGGPIRVPSDASPITDAEILSLVPELQAVSGEGGKRFERFDLRLPGRDGSVQAWWDEHLDLVRALGHLDLCGRTADGSLAVGLHRNGVLHATVMANSLVLRRPDVVIHSCEPLLQDPVPGSETRPGEIRYPDLPLCADYIDLVVHPQGGSLLERLSRGSSLRDSSWTPWRGRDSQGRPQLRWTIQVKGRSEPLVVPITLSEEMPDDKLHRAHWMIWPRFRTDPSSEWKAYYVYENCAHPRLSCDVLWVQGGRKLLRRRNPERRGRYPLSFRTGDSPVHTGGPPLALGLCDSQGPELGLYIVDLEFKAKVPVGSVAIGVDFGTSHSVAAVRVGAGVERDAAQVGLLPELNPTFARKALGLHLSEDNAHVRASLEESGILSNGSWLPTYREQGEGVIPSELILLGKTLREAQAQPVELWVPIQDFTIPPIDLARAKMSDHMLTDFKWDAGSDLFRGRESALREHYLGLYLELVLADVISNHAQGVPDQPVNLTFTYPLRSSSNQVTAFQRSLERLILRSNSSLGLTLGLTPPEGVNKPCGLFDESRAASKMKGNLGEVSLVGDLGGGTLDIFITAFRGRDRVIPVANGKPLDVADSVRIGANLLLHHMAEHAESYLPQSWLPDDVRARETGLRAWMRLRGAESLFGFEQGSSITLGDLKLRGFERPADAGRARHIIDRYFRLCVEYMARNLVAFLTKQWLPSVAQDLRENLTITVQLRGNGWRMSYQRGGYAACAAAIQQQVRERVLELWSKVKDNPFPPPSEDRFWSAPDSASVRSPKSGPVKQVVGQAMPYEEVQHLWFTHTLTDLAVRRNSGFQEVDWYTRIPFPAGGQTHVELRSIAPELALSAPGMDAEVKIQSLEPDLQSRVNAALQKEGQDDPGTATYRAPVAPLVWEAVFDSRQLWLDQV